MGHTDNIIQGEAPSSGAIFMANIGTKKECFRRKLFGLPPSMSNFVLQVRKGMMLFLFEFQKRQLYGVFRATSNGHINIVPNAFKSSGKQFPAQVRFTSFWNCSPLSENEFQNAIRDNYFSGQKFNFGLSEDQVCKLMMLFLAKRISKEHPARNLWRRGDKLEEGDGRFDDRRKNLIRDRIRFINKEDYHGLGSCDYLDDEIKEVDEARDRTGLNEDCHCRDVCEYFGDEVKEVDGLVHLKGNFLEEANNFNCGGGQGDRTLMVEGPLKDDRDRFLTNYMDFCEDDSRQAQLGKGLDYSLGGLRRVAEAGLHNVHDINDGHDVQNDLGDIRGTTNEHRRFMMENIKKEQHIEDGYRHILSEPRENHFGKPAAANDDGRFPRDGIANKSKFFMDDNRIQDEYISLSSQNFSAQHFGSPCDRGAQTINDGRFSGFESKQKTLNEHIMTNQKGTNSVWIEPSYEEGSTFCSRTLTEHQLFKPRAAGIQPGYDQDFAFGPAHNSTGIPVSHCKQNTSNSACIPIFEAQDSSVSELLQDPSEFSNIGTTYDYGIRHSSSCDTRMIVMPDSYDPEVPDILLRPFFAAGTGSSPDNRPLYPSSKEIHTSLSMGSLSYHSQNETPMRYFDCPLLSKSHVVEENRGFKTDSREGSQGLFATPSSTGVETAEKVITGHRLHGFSSGMSSMSAYDNRHLEEPGSKCMLKSSHASRKLFLSDAGLSPPNHHDKDFCETHGKRRDGSNTRVSVFARLTKAPDAVKDEQEVEGDEHDLHTSVDKVMKMLEKVVSSPGAKSFSAFKKDDDDNVKNVDYEVEMEPDVNEAIEVGSVLQETRLVDFKRRRKSKEKLGCERSAGNTDVGPVEKRRRLVRPVFERNTQSTCSESTPWAWKDDDKSTKPLLLLAGSQKDVIEGEGNGNGNEDGNENAQMVGEGGNYGEEKQVASSEGNEKMCGWIEW